jgi:hypothetical protein
MQLEASPRFAGNNMFGVAIIYFKNIKIYK